MPDKVLIVGGVAGGASAAARLRRLDEQMEIIVFERDEYISFANCGLPYHIGGVIQDREDLLVQTPEAMEARFEVDIRIKNEVIDIEPEQQRVKVRDLRAETEYYEDYDKLILSPGAEPVKPPIPGVDADNVFTLRNIPDTDQIINYIEENDPGRAVVVGGGFIGLEMAENLQQRGLKVTLVELAEQVMQQFDYEMASMIHNHLRTEGVRLHLNNGIKKIEGQSEDTEIVLQSGDRINTEMVVLALGVTPNIELAETAGLELGQSGGIRVNDYLQTSDEDIYAVGDAIEVKDYVTGQPVRIPLAGPANKQARIVANNICGCQEKYRGTQGTSVARVFELTVAATGNNQKQLSDMDIDYEVSYITGSHHVGYYPGAEPMTIKILYTADEGRLLGGQVIGHAGVDKRIDVLSTALRQGQTVFDLQELELAYAPPYGAAKDPINMAGFVGGNTLNGLVDFIHWYQLDELPEDTLILDVREEIETRLGSIDGSLNIPLNDLRDRLDELDQDREIVVYCAVGIRGYIAARILKQHGFSRVRNLSGGYKLYSSIVNDQRQIIESEARDSLISAGSPEEGKRVEKEITGAKLNIAMFDTE